MENGDLGEKSKSALRRALIARRSSVGLPLRSSAEVCACGAVARVLNRLPASSVFVYRSYGSEFPTGELISLFLSHSWTVLAPSDHTASTPVDALIRCVDGGDWIAVSDMEKSHARCDVSVIILPALGYDASGHRLGRGGGYYDRVLCQFPSSACRIGLGFSCQHLADVPHDAWDEPVDLLLSENGFAVTAYGRVRDVSKIWCDYNFEN